MNLLKNFKSCPGCKSARLRLDKEKAIICQDCQFTYFHNTAAAVAAIIEHDSKVLLVKRAEDPKASMWDLSGGFVDFNENAEQALIREVYEELNLKVTDLCYFTSAPNIYVYKDIPYYVLDLFFTCRATNINNIRPNAEIADFRLFSPDQIPIKTIAFESTKIALNYYIQNH